MSKLKGCLTAPIGSKAGIAFLLIWFGIGFTFLFVHLSKDPYVLEKAVTLFDSTEAEAIKALGPPIATITRAEIDSGKAVWPPPKLQPPPIGLPSGKCLLFKSGNRTLILYFDTKGLCTRVQTAYSK